MSEDTSALRDLASQINKCTDCPLAHSRTQAVPGEGPAPADFLFIGEAPGFNEDQQGKPFVGPAGKFLDQLLRSIDLRREDVFITNMIKCRPPGNRDPNPGELQACSSYLGRQIDIVRPKVIVTLGRHSLTKFFPKETISRNHGKPRRWEGMILYPLYHPAAALHQQGLRGTIEEDFRRLPSLLHQGMDDRQEEQSEQLSMF